MKKILYLILTFALGFLFAEIVRRPKMKRLQVLEANEGNRLSKIVLTMTTFRRVNSVCGTTKKNTLIQNKRFSPLQCVG